MERLRAASAGDQDAPSAAFDRFRTLVLEDARLQAELGDIEDAGVFLERTIQAARARAVALDAEDLGQRLRRPGARTEPAALAAEGQESGAGWLPVDLSPTDGQDAVEWAWFGRRRLSDPFFADTARRVLRLPFNRLFRFRTPLAELASRSPGLSPDGFIFHMSRCGSTLAAQMLGALAANIVVSEAPPIDAVVRLAQAAAERDEEAHVALLRAMVGALGRPRNPGEGRYVVKLDSWHALALPLFRRAFPDTPWVFLYRDPVEVMVSQARQRGVQMVPDYVPPEFYGLDLPGGAPDEDYWARVLAVICEAALDGYGQGGGLLVNYAQLPDALQARVLPHFGITPTAREHEIMALAARRDAKTPTLGFTPDSTLKRRATTPAIDAACDRHLAEVYRRLEVAGRPPIKLPRTKGAAHPGEGRDPS